ncbi:MAG: hypothetical protein ACI9FR_000248 [Cryomorphaceae bacterium]|jgi:hypothetical protein
MLDKINEFIAEPLPRKILFFDEMLTPSLIRLAYWLGLLTVVWTGLGRMFSNGFFGFFEGIVYIAICSIGLRVASELIMLFFKINENMETVAANSKTPAATVVKAKTAKKVSKKVTKKS